MRLASLLVLITLFSFRAFSQTTFTPGYIVRNGDTLRGSLKVDRLKNLMRQVSFRQDGKTGFAVLSPSDLSAFGYTDGTLYRSISFTNTLRPNPVPETVFAHALVSGAYTLYNITEDGNTYYIVRKDTATWFLYDDRTSGSDIVNGNYHSLLLFFSAGCEGLDQSRVSYSDKSLAAFMLQVDQCQGPGAAAQSNYAKPHTETHYFLYAGGLPAGYDHQYTLDAAERFVNPRIDPKASLNIGLRYSNTGTHTTSTYMDYIYNIQYMYVAKQTHVVFSVPVTFQYNLLSGRIQPAVYVGFSAAYLSETGVAPVSNQRLGIAVIGGACIEGYITPNFFIRADWRYELLVQNPSVGVGFKF